MEATLRTRKGTIADIPFLARIQYEASLPPLNHCFWDDVLQGTGTSALRFIEAMLSANASNWGNVSDFLILEEQKKTVAAAAGYTPNSEDYCPLRLSGLDEIAQDLNWSKETTGEFRDRYEESWGGDVRPFFLTSQATWIIEYVAVVPEARGRGLGKMLLKALLEEGRAKQHSHAGIMVINGNEVARRAYESIGFKPYLTFHADYFSKQYNIDFPGVTKFSLNLSVPMEGE
ncbi:MAG: GNAT family N-acetyltransferase [Plectolyngbya sp. WJT66-NPBG17]|jgi:ribosomal protein S18 acetylase RimI-like enzyme|nr:GNAT family N-acetyltransferase [Plectolyngbya sp. WJT66-NPBG17]